MINGSDTAWLMTATVLVLLMTLPALALFYGGLVQAKNILSVLVQCCAVACVASVLWFGCGYSLAYSGTGDWLGDLSAAFLQNGGRSMVHPGTSIPESVYVMFQMTFAIITPALIIGAFAERVRFGWVMLFSALWLMVVYLPTSHSIWGGGWMAKMGVRDFAGGIVVHTTAGVSALVLALMIGPRRGFPNHALLPHSPAMTMIGAGMLWVGWFGFNGGSALAADATAGAAILATHLAASTAACVWIALEWLTFRKATSVGIATGAVAGLATITPAAGFVSPLAAVIIGGAGAGLCFWAVIATKQRFKVDDSLDVFAVHGVGGMTGSLLLAIFSPQGAMGRTLGEQAIGVAVVALWAAIASFVLAKIAALAIPMRVDAEAEQNGLDLSYHGERAYELD